MLTACADTDVAIKAIKAINDIGRDYYLLKPWDPPADRLYPVIDDLLGDWRRAHPDDTGEVRVIGHRWSDRAHEIKAFLASNHVPYRWLDMERDGEAPQLLKLARAPSGDVPLVLRPNGETLGAPQTLDLASAWLGTDFICDAKGFIVTGQDLLAGPTAWGGRCPDHRTRSKPACPGSSPPATSGWTRCKRVASAVGEGAMSVYLVRRYVATI